VLTNDRLLSAFADPEAGAAAVSDEALGVLARGLFGGYAPETVLSEGQLWQAFPPLRAYRLVRVFPAFGPRRAPLYLLLPKRTP
jgi:hypothetical protein